MDKIRIYHSDNRVFGGASISVLRLIPIVINKPALTA